MKDEELNPKLKSFVVNLLRAGTFKWKARNTAKKRYKAQNGFFKNGNPKYGYYCAKCKDVFKSGEVQMDHLHAVVSPLHGFVGLNTYANRMYCDEWGYICLCPGCHSTKTKIELEFRTAFRALRAAGASDPELEAEYYRFLKEYEEKT